MSYSGEITFLRTRHNYDSYRDYWSLVELSGFATMFVDEFRPSMDGVFIVSPMNGEWKPHIDNHRGRNNSYLIHWNLERPSGSSGYIGAYAKSAYDMIKDRYLDEVWVSDRKLAEESGLKYIPVGSHADFGKPKAGPKRYMFCHMSAPVPRRTTLWSNFDNGAIGPNSWFEERHAVLQDSYFGLNTHQDNHPFQEPLRLALFASYGLPILSESLVDSYPYVENETILTCDYMSIPERIKSLVEEDYDEYRDLGLKARKLVCEEVTFRDSVIKAIQESIG